jgi:hypothetical protein
VEESENTMDNARMYRYIYQFNIPVSSDGTFPKDM